MGMSKGEMVLVKIRNVAAQADFITIGGMRAVRMVVNRQLVEAVNVASGAWRKALPAAGIASLQVQGHGTHMNSAAAGLLRQAALSGNAQDYRLYFGDGSRMEAECLITAYEHSGKTGEAAGFAMTLESIGAVAFVME